jgi:Protein involved in formate dehydrogenase formation
MNRPSALPSLPHVSIARPSGPSRREQIARARGLADLRAAVADPLNFYADVLGIQQRLAEQWPSLDPGASLSVAMPGLLAELIAIARPALAGELKKLPPRDGWSALVDEYWRSGGRATNDLDELALFVMDTLITPFAQRQAQQRGGMEPQEDRPYDCPWCGSPPIVAVLREEGHGARRSLLCGWCDQEWPAQRIRCLACDESRFDALPVISAEALSAVRVDLCETCGVYIKTIDLTRDGSALPLVDDLATLPLDLWARDHDYRRLRANALRI